MDCLLCLYDCGKAVCADLRGDAKTGVQQLAGFDNLIDQANCQGFVNRDGPSAEDHLFCPAYPDGACETLGAAESGDEPQCNLRQTKYRGAAGVYEIAGQRHLHAASERISVNCGDRRRPNRLKFQRDTLSQFAERRYAGRIQQPHLLDVRAGDECFLTGPGHNEHTDLFPFDHISQKHIHTLQQGLIQCIQRFWSTDSEYADVFPLFKPKIVHDTLCSIEDCRKTVRRRNAMPGSPALHVTCVVKRRNR